MKFYNRKSEIESLRGLGSGSLIFVYGRRRVGKTALVRRTFPAATYLFVEKKSSELLLSEFSDILRARSFVPTFSRWDEFFRYLFEVHKGDLIFDEFQNFVYVDPSVFSTIQHLRDEFQKNTFVAVGSYVGMMKKIFMDAKEPLYGRATAVLGLKPLNIFAVHNILSDLGVGPLDEKIEIYALFGGIPYYYELMERFGVKTFKECCEGLILDVVAPLKYEVKNVLVAEFGRRYSTYFSVLEAVSRGKCSLKEISDATGVPMKSLSKYLHELCEVYVILERKVPYGNGKKGRYFIKDQLTEFWFRFIAKNMSAVEAGLVDGIMDEIIQNKPQHVSKFFERVVSEILQTMGYETHTWWHRGEEIDIVAINRQLKEMVLCEVKWQNREVSWKIYEELIEKGKLVEKLRGWKKRYLVASKSGFTRKCLEKQVEEGVDGWDLKMMEKIVEGELRP